MLKRGWIDLSKKRRRTLPVIILIFVIGCIFSILYIKTDMLKTKEQLFWKYFLSEKDEIINIWSNNEIKSYNSKLKKSSYIKEGNISITTKNKMISPIDIKISEKGNNKEDLKNIFVTLEYDNKSYGKTTIIKDENYYLINNDVIGSNYFGFKNENLKQLASSLGIKNTDIIPNQIKELDYFELFSIDDVELNQILKKYIPICRKYVNNKDYNKHDESNQDSTIYELQVSRKQLKDLLIEVLNELKDDKDSLKLISIKIKMIDEDNKYCDTDNLKKKINDIIVFLRNKEADSEKFLSIIIYKSKNNVEKIEIVLKDDRRISIEKEGKDKLVIKQYDVENKEISIKSLSETIKTVIDSVSEITFKKNIVDENTNCVDLNITCDFGLETMNFKYNYVEKLKNNVDSIMRKDDVEYVDLKKYSRDSYREWFIKALKIND